MFDPEILEAQNHQKYLSECLSELLNDERIRREVFSTRLLWDKIAGNKNRGSVLYEISKWFIFSKDYPFKPNHWDYKDKVYRAWHSSKQLAEKTGLAAVTIDRIVRDFAAQGLLNYKVIRNDFGNPIRHFALNYGNLFLKVSEVTTCTDWSFHEMIKTFRSFGSFRIYILNRKKKDQDPDPEAEAEKTSDRQGKEKTTPRPKPQPKTATPKPESASNSYTETRVSNPVSVVKEKGTPSQPSQSTSGVEDPWAVEEKVNMIDEKVNTNDKKEAIADFDSETATENLIVDHNISNICPQTNLSTDEPSTEVSEITKARLETLILREDRPVHSPEGDKYFNGRNQQQEARERAKMHSTLGMSGFTSVEELEECEERLIEYYLLRYDHEKAEGKAKKEIKELRREGLKSTSIKEYLAGEVLGSRYCQEWERLRGVFHPIFDRYLRQDLSKNGYTFAHTQEHLYWYKKNTPASEASWRECKRIIKQEQPKLENAIALGIDPYSANIPQWFIEAYREDVRVEDIETTALILGNIAEHQNKVIEQHQEQISPKTNTIEQLPEAHPISQLLQSKKVLEGNYPSPSPTPDETKAEVDVVMDEIIRRQGQEPDLEAADEKDAYTAMVEEISSLLADPITREEGRRRAKEKGLKLLYDSQAEPIGIDGGELLNEESCEAHKIFKPKPITQKRSEADKSAFKAYADKLRSKMPSFKKDS